MPMAEDNDNEIDPPYHFIGACMIAVFIGIAMAVHGAGMANLQPTRAKPIAVAADTGSAWTAPIQ
jgi:hypothetical protein